MGKAVLQQYRAIQQEITQLEKQIDRLEMLARSPRISDLSGMPRSGRVTDGMDVVAKIEDLRAQYYAKLSQFLELQGMAENIMEGLGYEERTIVRYKYIDGLTNATIAERVHWSERTVRRRLKAAMKKLKGGKNDAT